METYKGTVEKDVQCWAGLGLPGVYNEGRKERKNYMFLCSPRQDRVLELSPCLLKGSTHCQTCGSVSNMAGSRCVPIRVLECDRLLIYSFCGQETGRKMNTQKLSLFLEPAVFICVLSIFVIFFGCGFDSLSQGLFRKPFFKFPVDLVCFNFRYSYLVIQNCEHWGGFPMFFPFGDGLTELRTVPWILGQPSAFWVREASWS